MPRSDAVNPTGEPLRGDEPDPAEIRTARAVENFLRKRLREFAAQCIVSFLKNAGWSSLVARQAHNLKVAGSNPAPATKFLPECRHPTASTYSKIKVAGSIL